MLETPYMVLLVVDLLQCVTAMSQGMGCGLGSGNAPAPGSSLPAHPRCVRGFVTLQSYLGQKRAGAHC